MRADSLVWTVLFTDDTKESVLIPDRDYQSSDHIYETVAQASSNPDEVDDFWPPSYDDNIPTPVPNCGHHDKPLTWLGQKYEWRCPACFPELFPSAAGPLSSFSVEQLTAELERRGQT